RADRNGKQGLARSIRRCAHRARGAGANGRRGDLPKCPVSDAAPAARRDRGGAQAGPAVAPRPDPAAGGGVALVITTAPDIRVEGVHIDDERLTVELTDGRSIAVPLAWYPRLFFVTAKQRQNWKLAGGGYGIHWPDIDEDLSTRESCVVRPRRAEAPPRLNLGPEQNKRPGPGWIDCSPYCFGLRRGG